MLDAEADRAPLSRLVGFDKEVVVALGPQPRQSVPRRVVPDDPGVGHGELRGGGFPGLFPAGQREAGIVEDAALGHRLQPFALIHRVAQPERFGISKGAGDAEEVSEENDGGQDDREVFGR